MRRRRKYPAKRVQLTGEDIQTIAAATARRREPRDGLHVLWLILEPEYDSIGNVNRKAYGISAEDFDRVWKAMVRSIHLDVDSLTPKETRAYGRLCYECMYVLSRFGPVVFE